MSVTKLAFIADLHYYSPRLGTSGRAYEIRSGADQKCLAQSGAVCDAAFSLLAASDVDAVCVAGDITNDGERFSHEEIYEKLRALNEKKPVYLITSTHDWCSDNNPRRFEGNSVYNDVETVGIDELREMYSFFGRDREIASFTTSKGFRSRCFQVNDSLRLIAVNDDCDGRDGKSGYSARHLEWMKKQISEAVADGCDIIAMEHHLLLFNISGLINKGQSISDNYETASALADAGLHLMFTGHSHMQRTTTYTSEAGNSITQVNLGSLCGYPAPITYITIENGKAEISVEQLEGFEYDGKKYTSAFFSRHTTDVLYNLLNSAAADKDDFKERLDGIGIHIGGYDKVYPIIRAAAKKVLVLTVGGAGALVNAFTFGKGVSRKAVREIKDDLLLEHCLRIFLSVFDGGEAAPVRGSAAQRIVFDVTSLPERVVKKLPLSAKKKRKAEKLTSQIKEIGTELVMPSAPDNAFCTIKLK